MANFDALQVWFVLPDGGRRARPYGLLHIARAGFNDTCLALSWDEGSARWSLMLDDPADVRSLLAAPPAALAEPLAQLKSQDRRTTRRRALGLSAVGLWLAAPLLLIVALVFAAGPLVSLATGLVSVQREQQLGAVLFKAQRGGLRLVENTQANAAVEEIGKRLTKGSAYEYHWFVTRDPSINAFAMPGGYVVVNTGLIEAAGSAEELAGVLAHEVQHVEQRHSLQQMARSLGLSAAVALVFGDVGSLGKIGGKLAGLKFSRDHETEADLRGLQALRRAGIDGAGMATMFRKLEKAADGVRPPAILSSHPATSERVAAIEVELKREAASAPPLPYDWSAVQADLGSGRTRFVAR